MPDHDLAAYRRRADRAIAEHSLAVATARAERTALAAAEATTAHVATAQAILQAVAQTTQEYAHARIAGIVTRCLAAVFDDPYELKLIFERKRRNTEARPVFTRAGNEYSFEEVGGGVVDVAAFALRLAALMMMRPSPRRVLFLDEPFKHLSQGHTGRVRLLLETLSKEMKVQFVIVTHNEGLKAGKIIELS
jgi:ABC-type hemin transport system ATPase subunit